MIQYDNVCAVAVFAESRGYLTPEEPRDFAMSKPKKKKTLYLLFLIGLLGFQTVIFTRITIKPTIFLPKRHVKIIEFPVCMCRI